MSSTAVYTCLPRTNRVHKDAVIFANIEWALAKFAEFDTRLVEEQAPDSASRSCSGLAQIKSRERIIALGCAAHTALADFQKRSLITSELDLEDDREGDVGLNISRLIWSCVNTIKVVALGTEAWRSVQLLPFVDRRFYALPPLRMAPSPSLKTDSVLIVNHDNDNRRAVELAGYLRQRGMTIESMGTQDIREQPDCDWSASAFFHVHVGYHSSATDKLRLIDSWQSQRLTLQLMTRYERGQQPDALLVETERNGFLCDSAEDIFLTCEEVRQDRILQKNLIEAGGRTVAPLVQNWMKIGQELMD